MNKKKNSYFKENKNLNYNNSILYYLFPNFKSVRNMIYINLLVE